MTEREQYSEKESVWHSRLFKFGVVVAALGVALGKLKVATAGVLLAGIGWAAWKGK